MAKANIYNAASAQHAPKNPYIPYTRESWWSVNNPTVFYYLSSDNKKILNSSDNPVDRNPLDKPGLVGRPKTVDEELRKYTSENSPKYGVVASPYSGGSRRLDNPSAAFNTGAGVFDYVPLIPGVNYKFNENSGAYVQMFGDIGKFPGGNASRLIAPNDARGISFNRLVRGEFDKGGMVYVPRNLIEYSPMKFSTTSGDKWSRGWDTYAPYAMMALAGPWAGAAFGAAYGVGTTDGTAEENAKGAVAGALLGSSGVKGIGGMAATTAGYGEEYPYVMAAYDLYSGNYASAAGQAAQVYARKNPKYAEPITYGLMALDASQGRYGSAVGRYSNWMASREEDPKKRLYWQLGGLTAGMAQNEYNRQAAAPSGEVPRESRQPAAREAAGGADMAQNYDLYGQYGNIAPVYETPASPYAAGTVGDQMEWGNSDPAGEIPVHERAGPVSGGTSYGGSYGVGSEFDFTGTGGRSAPREATPWYGSFTQPSTMGRVAGMAAPLAKVGLSYLTNMQQQKAMADERKARKKALSWIQQAQDNPESIYRNNPGLQQLRANRLNAVKASYAAKYGGTGGGRYMRDLMTQQAAFDQAALNDAINQRMQTVNATSYVPAAMAQYGGTSLGALTGAAGEGVGDAYYYNVLLPQMLEEQRRQRPTQP